MITFILIMNQGRSVGLFIRKTYSRMYSRGVSIGNFLKGYNLKVAFILKLLISYSGVVNAH